MKIYFANALFSHADFDYNAKLAAQIRTAIPKVDLYVPQENAAINNKEAYADSKMIAEADTQRLEAADLMIAILDGPVIDNGVATEVGVAYTRHIPILGSIQTVGVWALLITRSSPPCKKWQKTNFIISTYTRPA